MTETIQSEINGSLGIITLNRPKALNALNTEMCAVMTDVLRGWEEDEAVKAVLVKGKGERAFCAGGDVVMLHDSGKKDGKDAEQFWRTEYALNELIQRYPKPYIALIDGIVMGGGVGLSVHGPYRVAGDNTLFAMPETGIGYFPDVGGTYFLPRLGMSTGLWMGLTGARLKTADACEVGVATHYVPTDKHGELIEALAKAKLDGSSAAVEKVLKKVSKTPPEAEGTPGSIGAFLAGSAAEIIENLKNDDSEWAQKQLSIIQSKSPLAVAVTFEAIQRGGQMTFREAMTEELNISLNFLKTQDFFEGIRAQLIDKDRNPHWSHESVSDVTTAQIERLFKDTAKPPLEFLN